MVHFLQFVHLFCCSSSTKFLKPESGGSILALNHNIFMLPKVQQGRPKGPPSGFFRHSATFFRKFPNIIKGYPLHFLKFSVGKKCLLGLNDLFLGFSALCDFNRKLFKNILIFFQMLPIVVSGLVRLFFANFSNVSKGFPLQFFLFFQRMDVQKLPNAPFFICRHYATYRGPKKFENFQKKYFFLTWVL